MNSDAFIALFGAAILTIIVKVSNVVIAWLARVLKVEPPPPTQSPTEHTTS